MPYTSDQRNEITDIIQETVCALVNDESFLQKITERMWTKFEQKIEDKYQEIQHKTSVLQEENEKLREDLGRLEQYTKRNNIRIFGVKQEENENVLEKVIATLNNVGKVNIKDCFVDRCQRVGRQIPGKPQPIIVKFTSYQYRDLVIKTKRSFKHSNIFVKEDLTKMRLQAYKAACDKYGHRNV
ncbi:hypothetical protein ILUMI_14178 [Ignelater luminosus]|uniref:Uncharacterized protein n=1 Tax=Ignelater luminosus TaxID=2038154 RepID=A0A8K0CUR4_IGNLU|nr:hypothetical protein ILUMI_14178 [Ignelater luminosus]